MLKTPGFPHASKESTPEIVEFFSIPFETNSSVLTPRLETECLVRESIRLLKAHTDTTVACSAIIDVGTGSGILAICLKKHFGNIPVYRLDISPDALMTAKQNAHRNNVEIEWRHSNLLKSVWDSLIKKTEIHSLASTPIAQTHKEEVRGSAHSPDAMTHWSLTSENFSWGFLFFIANLPYIRSWDPLVWNDVLENDPHIALFWWDETGAECIEQFLEEVWAFIDELACSQSVTHCVVALEFGHNQLEHIRSRAEELWFAELHPFQDYSGIPRFLSLRYTPQSLNI